MWLWTLNSPAANGKKADDDEDGDEDEGRNEEASASGFKLEYDAARKIAQGLGAVLESLTHLVEVTGDQARLLPVSERTRHLFGKDEEEPGACGAQESLGAVEYVCRVDRQAKTPRSLGKRRQ